MSIFFWRTNNAFSVIIVVTLNRGRHSIAADDVKAVLRGFRFFLRSSRGFSSDFLFDFPYQTAENRHDADIDDAHSTGPRSSSGQSRRQAIASRNRY